MNEALFFSHIISVVLFSFLALRLGKEALISWIALQGVIANLFILKQIELFSFTVTCSDVYVIGSIMSMNLLQERYGRKWAQLSIPITFFLVLFFALTSEVHLFYIPSVQDVSQGSYQTILGVMPRILVASVAVFMMVQKFDIYFFGLLKQFFPKAPLGVRTTCSLCVSQIIDTILFTFLGLYGVVANVWDVIFLSMCVKLSVVLLMGPSTSFVRKNALRSDS